MSGNIALTGHETEVGGLGRLMVSQTVDADNLQRLLASLMQEDCVHSWKNFGADGTLEHLLEWENRRRSTQLFFFYLERGGQTRMVAASAVADRLSRDFPYPGFCVLGRCYIMPEFRSYGFYRQVLHYRLEYCRDHFGSALNAIHIGAVNDRISRVIKNHALPGWPRFVHLGEEELPVAGEIRRVGDYLLLLPDYLRRLVLAISGDRAPASVVALRSALSRLDAEPVRELGALAKRAYDDGCTTGWLNGRDCREIDQLLAFCTAIPLVGFAPRTQHQPGAASCEPSAR
jgi:hypothetical protein